jgi:uncharacterized protein involved in outer membrane biogenesis
MRWLLRPSRLVILAAGLVFVYALVGFVLFSYLIKVYAIPALAETLHRPVLVKEVELNPFALSIRVTGFEVREPDQSALLGFEEFFVNFEISSLIRQAYVFDTIRLTVPYVSARVSKEGRLNLTELGPPADGPEAAPATKDSTGPSAIPAVQIGHLEIAQGIVEFFDESKEKPVSMEILPIGIVLKNFHTKPGGDNTYAFMAELGTGQILDWKGTVSLEPIRSEGTLSLSGVKIPTFFQYVQDQFNFDIPSGTIEAKGQYLFDAGTSPVTLVLSDATVHFRDILLVEKGDSDPVIMVPSLDLDGIHLDLRTRTVSISSIAMANGSDRAWRNPDGSINLQSLFTPVTSDSSAPQAATPPAKAPAPQAVDERPWSLSIKEVGVTNHSIHFEDRSLALPVRVTVTGLSAKTHDFSFPITKPIPLTVEHRLNETGNVAVDGQIIVKPFQLDLFLAFKNIEIQPFQPYVERFARIAVDSGTIDLDGRIHLAVEHPKAPLMTFRGNLGVKALAIADRDQGSPVVSWKQFHLRKLALAVDPTMVSIEEVGLEQPMIHLAVLPDGQLNLKALFPQADAATPPSAPEAEPARTKKGPSPSIAIKTVRLLKGAVSFRDESMTPTVQTGLYDLTGTIKGLSSKQLAKADVELAANVDRVAPLKIVGTINPLIENAMTDLTVTLGGMDLTAESPYSGKYVGYGLSKGQLSLDLKYKVSQQQLEAENKVLIDQLTFGEKVESPDATSLPVPFAVALLKDRKGRIEIDLPIRGDLKDPDFKYGKVVVSTLLNILGKLVTSPFALMGKLIPGGGDAEELQYLEFDPGAVVPLPAEFKKVEAITKGLEERPGLRLEITGTADPVRDKKELGLQKLKAQLFARWRQGKGASKETDLPMLEEERLIKDLYDQQRSQQPVPAPAMASDPAPKPPTIDDMRQQLVAAIAVSDSDLRALAQQRADQVRGQFTGEGKLAAERVFLTEVDLAAADHDRVRSRLNITAGQ